MAFAVIANNLKTSIAIAVGVITIIGSVWVFANTFATNVRVDKEDKEIVEIVEVKFKNYEEIVAGAIQRQGIKSDYKFYQFQYDKLFQDKMEVKRQLRRDPTNQELRQDYIEIEEERKRIKEKMDELMKQIN